MGTCSNSWNGRFPTMKHDLFIKKVIISIWGNDLSVAFGKLLINIKRNDPRLVCGTG